MDVCEFEAHSSGKMAVTIKDSSLKVLASKYDSLILNTLQITMLMMGSHKRTQHRRVDEAEEHLFM